MAGNNYALISLSSSISLRSSLRLLPTFDGGSGGVMGIFFPLEILLLALVVVGLVGLVVLVLSLRRTAPPNCLPPSLLLLLLLSISMSSNTITADDGDDEMVSGFLARVLFAAATAARFAAATFAMFVAGEEETALSTAKSSRVETTYEN